MQMNKTNSYHTNEALSWHESLDGLRWERETQTKSISWAFEEALRRRISRSEAFSEVAERIYRSFIPVNWGLLNWQWKLLSNEFAVGNGIAKPTTPPAVVPAEARPHQIPQRRAASLVSYYM